MKKIILFTFLVMSISLVFAELEVDIPFDMDIIGDSFATNGSYVYESEWITITNIGSTTETYTLFYSDENVPNDWNLSICNSSGACFMANWAVPLPLAPGEFEEIHILVTVTSTGGFPFSIILDEGDLIEPISLDFTFNTADNVSADDEIVYANKLMQNYPNPFKPSGAGRSPGTTISFSVPQNSDFVNLEIYNLKGQKVKTLDILESASPSPLFADGVGYSIIWNGTDESNQPVSSGVYFYKLNNSKFSEIKKMILMK